MPSYADAAPPSQALFARAPRRHPRRRELPGARLPRRRRHAALHGARPRPVPHRRRRPRVRRPGLLVGPDDPRPRAPRGRRGGARARPRAASRSARPARTRCCSPRRSSARVDAGRAGAAGHQRHRGDDVGDPAGPRLHRPRQGREVRRLLPRPRRRAAGRGRLRRRHLRAAGHPRRHRRARPPTRSCCPTTTSPRSRPRSPRTATRSPASSPRPPPPTWASSPPQPGFNAGARRASRTAHGALLIIDEVMTGFRVAAAAGSGSSARTDGVGARPVTFGKVMGGGLPAAAFGGRADVMAHLAPAGPVYQAGTLAGNPVATAARPHHPAALHAERLRPPRRHRRDASAASSSRRWPPRASRTASQHGGHAVLASSSARRPPCATTTTARTQEAWRYAAFFHAMLDHGVYLPPSAFEAWFVSAAHDDAALDRLAAALPARRAEAAAARAPGRSPMECA